MSKINLIGLHQKELAEFAVSMGEPAYRGTQLFGWIYGRLAQSFDEMTDISKSFRTVLEERTTLETVQPVRSTASDRDTTTKYLFRLNDGLMVESVLIPAEEDSPGAGNRLTVCISTQVGCPLDCAFCATGTMGFKRNLTAGEIAAQALAMQRLSPNRISNVVFMGMGEPMLNYDNTMKAAELITDDRSLNIGARHITISTAGYADAIRRMGDEKRKFKLALSLHSLRNDVRKQLMPITKKYDVGVLLGALEYYYKKTKLRPTFEYIPFDGINDTNEDLKLLIAAARRIPSKVNIIPFHPIAFTDPHGFAATLRPTPRARMETFIESLRAADITVMVRSSAGEDINAACGQLAVAESASAIKRARSGAPSSY